MRVIAYTKYGREAASTRQRVLQYRPALAAAGIEVEHRGLLSDAYVRSLVTGEHWSRLSVLRSYWKRLLEVFGNQEADLIWVYAEMFPYLPAGFETLILRHGIPVVYDYDDAFFISYNQSSNPIARGILSGKLERFMSRVSAVVCGNEYLREHAARYCQNTVVVPTVVDTEVYRPARAQADHSLTIGWIGSPSTWANVRPVLPAIERVCAERQARFRVVGAGRGAERDRFPGMELVDWTESREVAEVQGFDVGIAPLVDAPFQRGKSGYKLIQYLACGIPAVSSPVGANNDILTPATGVFAETPDEWHRALDSLLSDPELRARMGAAGRQRAIKHYSLKSQVPRLLRLFNEIVQNAPRPKTLAVARNSESPMRLLFIIKSLTLPGGGAERVLSVVTAELSRRGHEVVVASFDEPGREPFYRFDPRVKIQQLAIGDIRQQSRGWEVAWRMRTLRQVTMDLRPDAVIGFMHSAYVPLGVALLGTGIPVIASEHTVYQHYRYRPFQRLLLSLAAPTLRIITAISEPMRLGFPRHLRRKMSIIANPVDRPTRLADVRGGSTKILLSVGRLDQYKDHATLISAFARIADRFPDWQLRIVGEGFMRPSLEQQVDDLGLGDRVDLAGAVSSISDEYAAAQLFVLPSRYESFGLATGEAMSHGLPVIGFADCPGTNEIIRDEVDGLLVEGDHRVENLAKAMARLMGSLPDRRRMGEAAKLSNALAGTDAIALDWEKLLREAATR